MHNAHGYTRTPIKSHTNATEKSLALAFRAPRLEESARVGSD